MIEIIAPKTLGEIQEIWLQTTRNINYCMNEEQDEQGKGTGYFNVEIYTDYYDEFDKNTLIKAFKHNNPIEYLENKLCEWSYDYKYDYALPEIKEEIKQKMSEEDKIITEIFYEDDFNEWCDEHIYYYYDWNDFNKIIKVNIVIDSGDAATDFSCNSILNYYGTAGQDECNIDERSSIMWLANQQGKGNETEKEICYVFENNERKSNDKFINSVITELENLPSYCGMLTFLVEMTIEDLCKLKAKDKDFTKIIISKNTMCGLFESWNGSGSVLEIELDKDIEIPKEMIWDAWMEGTKPHGYDIDEVYGLIDSAWHGNLEMVT